MAGTPDAVYDPILSQSRTEDEDYPPTQLCEHIPARLVLYFLSWTGFIVSFILRNDINLTILAMVKEPKQPTFGDVRKNYCYDSVNVSEASVNYGGTLEWSTDVQYYIIASFYWPYVFSQLLGGVVAQHLGTKTTFGFAQLATAVCSFFIPVASGIHYGLVIALKFTSGFASGFTWPAMYAIIGHWIPKHERSRFVSSFQGYNIGTGISLGLCGYIIKNMGWKYVFYTTGSLGMIWCIFWYFLAFDCPETHPRISPREKQYIKNNTKDATLKMQTRVPWRSIFTSVPVWSIAIASFGRMWILYTFAVYGPLYMKAVLGFSVEKNGVWAGAPFAGSYIVALLSCYIADKLISYKALPLVTIRKIFTGIAQVIPGLLCILLEYLGCNITLILVTWFVATVLLSASFAGVMSNIVDISPNFSSPVLAFVQTILLTSTLLSPVVVTQLTKHGHTLFAWQTIFNISGALVIIGYIVYHIWGTSDIQPWDRSDDSNESEREEMLYHQKRQNELVEP